MGGSGSGPSLGSAILQLLGLFLALGFVVFLAWLSSRLIASRLSGPRRSRNLRVLDQVPVGRDRHLLLVQVGDRVLLVGSTADNVSLLTTFDDPADVTALSADRPATVDGVAGFGALLQRFMQQGGVQSSGGGSEAGDEQAPASTSGPLADQIRRLRDIAKR